MAVTRRATPPLLRALNERTVLEAIREGAPISRAEISRRSGISKPTVSLALRSLLDAGLVREAARGPDGPGYGAVYFEAVAEAALVLGLDLGARFVRGALCDLEGAIRARQDVELASADAAGATEAIARLRASMLDTAALDPSLVDCVVIGVPGVVAADGTLQVTENVAGLEGRRFGEELQAALDLPGHARERHQPRRARRAVAGSRARGRRLRLPLCRDGHGRRGRPRRRAPSRPQRRRRRARLRARRGRRDGRPVRAAGRRARARPRRADGPSPRAVFGAARTRRRRRARGRRRGSAPDRAARRARRRRGRRRARSSSAAGSAPTATYCSTRSASCSREWLPFPPRVEVSTLGEAAVLTGAVAVGLQAALENVFARRAAAPA